MPGQLTSFRPRDDRLWVALGLALEIDCLTLDHSSVCRCHGELGKSFRKEDIGNNISKAALGTDAVS